jgi:curli biogenesis system outer membrane secretion channel CsgG
LEELIMNKQTKVWLVLSIALSLLALGSACSKESGTNAPADRTADAGATPYSGPTGTIAGVISLIRPRTPRAAKRIRT